MKDILNWVLEKLGGEAPLWLILLIGIIYFFTGPIRQMINDAGERRSAEAKSKNTNKEQIEGLVQSAHTLSLEIRATRGLLDDDVSTLIACCSAAGQQAEEIAQSYTAELDSACEELTVYLEEIDEINIFDGDHDNLLRTRAILSHIRRVKQIADQARIDANRAVSKLTSDVI